MTPLRAAAALGAVFAQAGLGLTLIQLDVEGNGWIAFLVGSTLAAMLVILWAHGLLRNLARK